MEWGAVIGVPLLPSGDRVGDREQAYQDYLELVYYQDIIGCFSQR